MAELGDDIAFALGRMMRGIVHECVNPLNGIAMTAELVAVSSDDPSIVQECAATISRTARDGGTWLRQLGALASADDLSPTGDASLTDAVILARALIGSRARAGDCEVSFKGQDAARERPLHKWACAVTVALIVDTLLAQGARCIAVIAQADAVNVDADRSLHDASVALRLAERLCAEHGGDLSMDGGNLTLRFR